MTHVRTWFIAGVFAFASSAFAAERIRIVTLNIAPIPKEMKRLGDQGLEIAGVNWENDTVDVILRAGAHLAPQFQSQVLATKEIDPSMTPDVEYQTPAKVTAALGHFVNAYPAIAHLESIGKSLEGRDIWALSLSNSPGVHNPSKPVILFNGMHHAREVMSTEVPLDIIAYLTRNYGQDAAVTQWIDHNEIWIVPMVNPDGNNKVWTTDTMWRKNARGGYGVDINRNYPYGWNSCNGSSDQTSADNYRGTAPASEPETQAMMAFINRIQPVFDISYHTYSELVLYPFGCRAKRTPDFDVVETIGKEIATKLKRDSGSGTYTPGTPWELLYNADGGDIDWLYMTQHVIPYVIEVNSSQQGFQPSYAQWRNSTIERMRPGWMLLLDKLNQSGVRGMVRDARSNGVGWVNVAIVDLSNNSSANWLNKKDGSFHFVLRPGQYRLTFQYQGQSIAKDVTVATDLQTFDVQF